MKKANISHEELNPFALRLKELIGAYSCIQEDIAKYVGVTRQGVGNWVNGTAVPDILTASRVADFFDVSLDYLIGKTSISSVDPELKAVCEYTGLDDNAVKLLSQMNEEGKNGIVEKTLILDCLSYFVIWGMKDFISSIINNYKELQKKEREKKQLKSDTENLQSAISEKNFESTQKYLKILDRISDIDEEIAFIEYKNLRGFHNNMLKYLYDLLEMKEAADNGEHQTPKE